MDGSKLTKDSILKNNTRNKIFKYILKNPGAHLREIRDKLNLSPHQAAYHLIRLEQFNFIRKTRINYKVAYFNSKINPKFDKSIFAIKDEINFKILKYVLLEPDIKLDNLVKKVQLKLRKVKKIIFNLKESDLIDEIIEHGQIKYRANKKNFDSVLKILKFLELDTTISNPNDKSGPAAYKN
ncbi:MAG: winged helix-turn-helix transcriptional regulator [Candidatus Hodarchaeota archaeon]